MVSPRIKILAALLLLSAPCGITTAKAQTPPATSIPSLMNFQGRLAKPDGTPVADGTYTLTFRIYSGLTGGTKKWEQSINPVLVHNGVFSVLLGNGNPLDANVFNGMPYLEVQIGSDAPLAPRQPFASVSFAFKANTVPDGAIGSVQLGDGAVTSAKIQDGAVTNGKIAAGAITGDKILDGTIGSGKLTAGAITPTGPAGGDLTGNYPNPIIAADKVNAGKLASDMNSMAKVSGGAVTVNSGGVNFEVGRDIYANGNINIALNKQIGYTLGDNFTMNGKQYGNYSLGWFPINSSAQAYISGYGGIRFVTGGNTNMFLNGGDLSLNGFIDVGSRLFLRNGIIANDPNTPVVGTTDLGLYSHLSGQWMRFVTNNGNFRWYSTPGSQGSGEGTNAIMSLDTDGTLTTKVLQVNGSDVAEPYDVLPSAGINPLPGMVVSIDTAQTGRMRLADHAFDRSVAGIISGANGVRPGVVLRQPGTIADGKFPVASLGRVWCWCDADANGPIEPGDFLTTSATAGHAMRADDSGKAKGAVIGKAMSSLKSGKGLVFVLVTLQ